MKLGMNQIAGLPDINAFDQSGIGVNVFNRRLLIVLSAPNNIPLKKVIPDITRARVGADLEGNADLRQPAVEIEVPLSHGRVEIGSDAAFHRRAQLLGPAILKNGYGTQQAGNPQDNDIPKESRPLTPLPVLASTPSIK